MGSWNNMIHFPRKERMLNALLFVITLAESGKNIPNTSIIIKTFLEYFNSRNEF